jgi:hypothetical protein
MSKKKSKKIASKALSKASVRSNVQFENDDDIDRGDLEEAEYENDEFSLTSLEAKYSDQMRQIYPVRIDLSLFGLKAQIEHQIELKPEFQRRNRWNEKDRSRFIESIIMNVPVPPVFLGEEKYGKYVVLDGRQRLTAVYRFLSDDLRLEGLKVWTELNGKVYSQIQEKGFGATIERRFLPGILLAKESSPEVKYEVFDRLNTGGIKANPMEVRNAVFPGEFNRFLHHASSQPDFRRLWGLPITTDPEELEAHAFYRQMDDIASVLRFFALRRGTLDGMKFKDYLNDYMSTRNRHYQGNSELRQEDEDLFSIMIENCISVFGYDAFVKPDGTGKRSVPYADAVMQAFADPRISGLTEASKAQIRAGFQELVADSQFKKSISTGTNGPSAINTRISMAKSVVRSAIGKPASKKKPKKKAAFRTKS